jgi:hypothetical protein
VGHIEANAVCWRLSGQLLIIESFAPLAVCVLSVRMVCHPGSAT